MQLNRKILPMQTTSCDFIAFFSFNNSGYWAHTLTGLNNVGLVGWKRRIILKSWRADLGKLPEA